jgi:glucose-1-phosphate thymidylyltransferase
MKGIVLAGGTGSRLGELTKVTNKHLLPVGDKPMIYHPLSKIVEAGIKDVMIVSGTEHMGDFIELLGSGSRFGCSLTYKVQDEAGGIAQALGLTRDFCANQKCLVVLGDNIFDDSLASLVAEAKEDDHSYDAENDSAWIMLKEVPNASRYGVANFSNGSLINVIEKPEIPPSDFAITGIYIYPPDVFGIIDKLVPSKRNELEITDVNNYYIENNRMNWRFMDGFWTDAGTLESWFEANQLIRKVLHERRKQSGNDPARR